MIKYAYWTAATRNGKRSRSIQNDPDCGLFLISLKDRRDWG